MQSEYNFSDHFNSNFEQIPNIKKWIEIYKKEWNKKWEESEKNFQKWIKAQSEQTQNDLQILREHIKILFDASTKDKTISDTFIRSFTEIKNLDEFKEFYNINKEINNLKKSSSSYPLSNIMNCGLTAKFVEQILTKLSIENAIIGACPDHAFNISRLNGKIYFIDIWSGGIIREFEPEIFFKYGELGGVYDLSIEIIFCGSKNGINIESFREIISEMNDSLKQNNKIKEIMRGRLLDYANSIDLNNYILHFEKINNNKLYKHFTEENKIFSGRRGEEISFINKMLDILNTTNTNIKLPQNFIHKNSTQISPEAKKEHELN